MKQEQQSMEDIPRAGWVERYAAETLKLKPELNPLDAVREALSAFPDTTGLKPENAAEAMFAIEQLVELSKSEGS
jgi:hypothetical protein